MEQLTISDTSCMLVAGSVTAKSFEYSEGPGAVVNLRVARQETRLLPMRFVFRQCVVYAARPLHFGVGSLLVTASRSAVPEGGVGERHGAGALPASGN